MRLGAKSTSVKKCYRIGGRMQHMGRFICKNFSSLLERGFINYELGAFYNCRDCMKRSNILLNEHMFNGAEKYLPGYKHHLNMMVSCVRFCMGAEFERVVYLQTQIIRVICSKCQESVTLENTL